MRLHPLLLCLLPLLIVACTLEADDDVVQLATAPPTLAVAVPPVEPPETATPLPTLPLSDTPAPQPTDCAQPPGWVSYTVQPGDTLGDIAARAGTTTAQLQAENCLADPNLIVPNQTLWLPRVPQARLPTSVPAPQITLSVTPTQGTEGGFSLLRPGELVTLTLTGLPAGTGEARFYLLPTGTGVADITTQIGLDESISGGQASVQWLVPAQDTVGRLVASGFNTAGANLGGSNEVSILVDTTVGDPVGQFGIGPQLAADAGSVSLLRESTVSVTWDDRPASVTRVRFWLQTAQGEDALIGFDDNMADGARVNWFVPPNLAGSAFAYGYDSSDVVVARSFSLGVGSGPTAGQGCFITVTAAANYYQDPGDLNATPVGSLAPGTTIESLGRSLDGWYAIDPDGGGVASADDLVWLPQTTPVNLGANCG